MKELKILESFKHKSLTGEQVYEILKGVKHTIFVKVNKENCREHYLPIADNALLNEHVWIQDVKTFSKDFVTQIHLYIVWHY